LKEYADHFFNPFRNVRNQIPQFPNIGRQETHSSKPALISSSMEIYPQPPGEEQGWGLSFFTFLHPSRTGRSAGTGYWSGLANLVWWVDRKREIAGVMFSQILPFGGKPIPTNCPDL
jgi:CubicO group peptidase (beta-lactamase class C family)